MHKFNVEIRGRKLVATDTSKQNFLDKLLDDYDNRNITVQVSFEIPQKNINSDQERLYRAFIVKAADHFGTDYGDMQYTLKPFWPRDPYGVYDYKPINKWTSADLDNFISKSMSHIGKFDFHF